MKIILKCLFVVIAFASCNELPKSNESKAKELITNYFKNNLNDPDSYEPVDFGELDSLFINPGIKKNADVVLAVTGDTTEYNKTLAAEKHKFSGFHLTHTFRFKNAAGGTETHTWEFNFNSTLENIANIEKTNDKSAGLN